MQWFPVWHELHLELSREQGDTLLCTSYIKNQQFDTMAVPLFGTYHIFNKKGPTENLGWGI